MTHDEILDATDSLAAAGCDDASIGGHKEGMELLLERSADALQSAGSAALADIEPAGYVVTGVEQQRETFAS